MARTEEAEWWSNAVYEAVQEIPKGRVTSYGHIAKLLGQREESEFSLLDSSIFYPFSISAELMLVHMQNLINPG